MDQNQFSVDNDLQKAIDDITITTNSDPAFSNPFTNSTTPEDGSEKMNGTIGPLSENQTEAALPEPEPMAPLNAMDAMPDLPMPEPAPQPENAIMPPSDPNPAIPAPTPEQVAAPMPEPAPTSPALQPDANVPEPVPQPEINTPESAPQGFDASEIKKAALRDLAPLLTKLEIDKTQKFDAYKEIFENLKDYSVLDPAYQTAREIPDETKRAESLLYLIEAIDKM